MSQTGFVNPAKWGEARGDEKQGTLSVGCGPPDLLNYERRAWGTAVIEFASSRRFGLSTA